jgi:NAD(P)-dependent dehydrogenase (short-subunit alcohol dehydrogenase family)
MAFTSTATPQQKHPNPPGRSVQSTPGRPPNRYPSPNERDKMSSSSDTTIVIGASRGLGRGIASSFAEAGNRVIAVARTSSELVDLARANPNIGIEVADATDATVAATLIARHEPKNIVLVAGATPLMRPLQQQTWETFSENWNTDVHIAFHWLRETLLKPLQPGSTVIVISSGAALNGSPLSGGYAGAKATQRFMTSYAQNEAERADLGITYCCVLPRMTPLTEIGRVAAAAYAVRNGQSQEEYLKQMGEPLTPEQAGTALVNLVSTDHGPVAPAYLLTGAGLKELQ